MAVNKSNQMRNQNDTVIYLGHYLNWCYSMPLYAGEVFLSKKPFGDRVILFGIKRPSIAFCLLTPVLKPPKELEMMYYGSLRRPAL